MPRVSAIENGPPMPDMPVTISSASASSGGVSAAIWAAARFISACICPRILRKLPLSVVSRQASLCSICSMSGLFAAKSRPADSANEAKFSLAIRRTSCPACFSPAPSAT
jgi:hypothetical protein